MRPTLRFLLVEDSPADAELIFSELRKQGWELDGTQVETEEEFRDALRADLDVVLSDYKLPQFSALRALLLLQERFPNVPFIIVSGAIEEETAVAAMRKGAADFLLKDRLGRLGSAVKQAIEKARLRSEAEDAAEQLRLFRALVDQSNDIVEVIDAETARFLDVNDRGCREMGYSGAEYRRLHVWDLDGMLKREKWAELTEAVRSGGAIRRQGLYQRRDGSAFPVEVNARWVEQGRNYIVAVVRDVTAQNHALEVVRESERRFREMLENVDLIAMTLDRNGTVTFCNDYLLRVSGWQREEVIGSSWFTKFIPDQPEVMEIFLRTFENGEIPPHYENPIRTKSGGVREISWNNTMLRGLGGKFIGTASIGKDVTEKRHALRALQQSEERFRSFMEHSPIAGWIVDEDGRFQYASPGYYRMFDVGQEDVTGERISDLYAAELAAHYIANNEIVLNERRVLETVETGLRADGSPGEFVVVKFPMTGPEGQTLLGGIALDVTERKKLEQQFLRTQRMEMVGTMAGGIAHDLNNSLGPILMSLDLLQMKFTDADSRELLEIIRGSAQRGADMVRQLLAFGRGSEGRQREVAVPGLVREIEKIVNDTFLKNIDVEVSLPGDLRSVMGDKTQLHQVLLNLCLNARDAMQEGGRLWIAAENLTVDEQYAGLNADAKPGSYVRLTVKDSGTGIPPELLSKIFDPFFTTKEVGKGTGLGLASTLAIVKSHGGFIEVESDVRHGTSFRIHLPAHAHAAAVEATHHESTMPRGKGEWVLVVDDEAAVREITRRTLEAHGYRVILATDGANAVGKVVKQAEEIAAVVMDMTMPVLDGPATIQVLQRLKPRLPVIATSGRGAGQQVKQLQVAQVLEKPFTAEALLTALALVLSTAEGGFPPNEGAAI